MRTTRNKNTHWNEGNLNTHAKKCWGDEAVKAVKDTPLDSTREAIKNMGKKGQRQLTTILGVVKGWAKLFSTTPPTNEAVR